MPLASFSLAVLRGTLAVAIMLVAFPPAIPAFAADAGLSAADILSKAEAQARAEHKNILLDFGASWCGNCRLYHRFLADPQMNAILSRAFVFATMDTGERQDDRKHSNTPGGVDFENSIGGKGEGFPWLVMLDTNGTPIVNSDRPDPTAKSGKGNVGYPDAPEEIDWFVEMLRKGAPQLSQQDLTSVHAWLATHSTAQRH